MWLTIVIMLLLCGLLYVLLAPLRIVIDTASSTYMVFLPGLFKVQLESDKTELVRIRLNLLLFKFYFYPLRRASPKPKKSVRKSTGRKKRMSFKQGVRLLKSFKVEKLLVTIDTGNYATNARLFSLYGIFNYHKEHLQINFQGKNQLALTLRNRPINLLKSFLNL